MSKELKTEFETVKAEGLAVITKARAESRDLTAEETEANAKRFARCEQIKTTLADENRFAALAAPELAPEVVTFAKGNHELKAKTEFQAAHAHTSMTTERHNAHINAYIRGESVPAELFTIVSGAGGGTNGVTLPTGPPIILKRQRNPIKAALDYYGLPVYNVPGGTNFAVYDDSACDALTIAQDSGAHNICEPVVTNYTGDTLADSQAIWFSNTLLSQAGFDFVSTFRPMLDARIEKLETTAWFTTVTDGVGAASVGSTAATTTGVSYQDLVDLKYSIPDVGDAVFFVSRGLMAAVEGMVDENSRPLYRDSLSEATPNLLLGLPVFISEALDTPAAGAVSGVIASASSLMAREWGGRRIVKYENYPLKPDQVGLRIFGNHGFGFVTSNVKLLRHPLS